MKVRVERATRSLLSDDAVPLPPPDAPVVPHWTPRLSLHLVDDHTMYPRNGIPPQLQGSFHIVEDVYFPVVYFEEFWVMKEHRIPVNESVTELGLEMSFEPIALWRWQLYEQMQESFRMQETLGTAQEGDSDEMKVTLTADSPYPVSAHVGGNQPLPPGSHHGGDTPPHGLRFHGLQEW
jgi:hypothetical protein